MEWEILAQVTLSPQPRVGLEHRCAGCPVMGQGACLCILSWSPSPRRTGPSPQSGLWKGAWRPARRPPGSPQNDNGVQGSEIQTCGPRASDGGAVLGKREETSQAEPQSEPLLPGPQLHTLESAGAGQPWARPRMGMSEARLERRPPRSS